MEEQTIENARKPGTGKLKIALCCGLLVLGFIFLGYALFLRTSVGKYAYISAEEKNAYITNIDNKTEPPLVYISYDYSPDRYIIGLLPSSEYNENMKEGDWVSIFYNVDSLRQITFNNPYKKSNGFLILGAVILVLGIISFSIFVFRKK